jgi:hypothetical protein
MLNRDKQFTARQRVFWRDTVEIFSDLAAGMSQLPGSPGQVAFSI